jgi:TldD protein
VRKLAVFLTLCLPGLAAAADDGLLKILAEELDRNYKILSEKADPKVYYISYSVTERHSNTMTAELGVLVSNDARHLRQLDVTVRVGSPKLDNYHPIRGNTARFAAGITIPIDDSPDAIKRRVWNETDRVYRLAAQRLINITTSNDVQVAKLEGSDDFAPGAMGIVASDKQSELKFNEGDWTKRLKSLSARFLKYPQFLQASVGISAQTEWKYFVDSEGARLSHGRPFSRIVINAQAKAADGMDLSTFDSISAGEPGKLPKDEDLAKKLDKVADDLAGLLKAPVVQPFVGPAILSGRAAGVFFHEIFGHRIEGHRLKDESDGQTFAKQIGQPVLPKFLSVTMDPTIHQMAGEELNGWFDYDDEGIRSRKVNVVEEGILKTFLMSRTPTSVVTASNGHGRKEPGREPVSRQSNLIVGTSTHVTDQRLREMLIEEIKRQNKPFGFYFADITGGYTNTGRGGIQAFKVIPLVVYRIYPDGRPDELVRGTDLVGTPLASFGKILAAGETIDVFNGYCGAESGSVPVSAISPPLLVSEIEIQKNDASTDRPPILPAPLTASAGGAR